MTDISPVALEGTETPFINLSEQPFPPSEDEEEEPRGKREAVAIATAAAAAAAAEATKARKEPTPKPTPTAPPVNTGTRAKKPPPPLPAGLEEQRETRRVKGHVEFGWRRTTEDRHQAPLPTDQTKNG